MSKIFKWGLLALIAVGVLIKVSLWLSVRSVVEEAIARLSPVMEISYGGITSSFDGRIGLDNLQIRVPAAHDSLHVDHAQLRFRNLSELLSFKERLDEGKLPKQLAMELTGVQLQIHGPFIRALYDEPADRSVFTAMSEVACGDVRNIGADELLQMGYRTLDSNIEFSYLFEPGAQHLTFNLRSDTRDMLDLKVSTTLTNVSERPGDMRVNPPRVSRVIVEMDDNQYQRRVQEFCAAKMRLDQAAYIKRAVQQFDHVLRLQRIALDAPLLDAYGRYLADPRSLRLELDPTEGMVWGALQFFEARDVVNMLRPVVLVNQEAVQPLGFAWLNTTHPAAETVAETPKVTPKESVESNNRTQQYEFVSVEDLSRNTGRRLQFITFDGAFYQGVLHKVENGKVYITVQMGTGTADMFLRLNKINQVRVMR
ncbi:MAG: hypothetical protein GAK45_01139 [Pseudomonas citronellolis]|nr:MAG: hypothetical protein GAK45_01139 [Pseudomonas citronellolis]